MDPLGLFWPSLADQLLRFDSFHSNSCFNFYSKFDVWVSSVSPLKKKRILSEKDWSWSLLNVDVFGTRKGLVWPSLSYIFYGWKWFQVLLYGGQVVSWRNERREQLLYMSSKVNLQTNHLDFLSWGTVIGSSKDSISALWSLVPLLLKSSINFGMLVEMNDESIFLVNQLSFSACKLCF